MGLWGREGRDGCESLLARVMWAWPDPASSKADFPKHQPWL